jgi:Creatinase/Prolidase N-terminal domain/Metallopeptidase family M24
VTPLPRMDSRRARLAPVQLPDFGPPPPRPDLPPELYATRLDALRGRMAEHDLDRVVLFADREHSANLAWLTGFDPRFEEAILIVGPDAEPAILVGNECWGTAGAAPLPMRRHLHQDLSLPAQPRDRSRPLGAVLAEEGIGQGRNVGVVGWKGYDDAAWLDAPSYLVDVLRSAVGAAGSVTNEVGLFNDAGRGLRVINEGDQLAAFEAAACRTSSGVRNLIENVRPGMSEREAVALLGWDGSPLSCHVMLSAGPRAALGLLSPGDRRIERGDPLTTAFGIWGALNCRAGFVIEDESGLPEAARDYVDRLVAPYFEAVAAWYGALRVGQTGGALHEIVMSRIGDPFFGVRLNPGHQISLDEWVNSPVAAASQVELRPGMYLQVDVIPATGTPYFTTNIEDGVALADEALRAELERRHPEMWARVTARRDFMRTALGIDLHPDVLPFSNMPAWLPPFLLGHDRAMTLS